MTFGVALCQKEFWTSKHNSSLCFSRPISTSSRNANRWLVQFHVLFSESVLCFGQLIRTLQSACWHYLFSICSTKVTIKCDPSWMGGLPLWTGVPWARASVEGKLPFLATEIWLPSLIATSPFPPDGPGVEGPRLSLTCLLPWRRRNLPASLLLKSGSHCPYSGIRKPLYRWFWKALQCVPVLAYLVVFFFFPFASGFLSLCVHTAFLVLSSVPHPEGCLFVLIKTHRIFFLQYFNGFLKHTFPWHSNGSL